MLKIDTYTPQPRLNTKLFFGIFCLLHLLLWTLIPTFMPGSVPQDTLEGIVWGNQWQWGYDKHPPLAAWLSALATKLGGTVGWPVYLLAQFAILITFWAIWRLGRRFLPPLYALISVLLLEGIMYYNILSPKFNPGTLMTPVWALSIFAAYVALREQKIWQWLLVGIVTAANIYTKYQAPLIILPLFIMLCITPEGRRSFKSIGFYCSILLCFALIIPHLEWSIQHNFIELKYALARTGEDALAPTLLHKIINHIWNPIILLLSQLGAMAGLFFMLIPFYKTKRMDLHLNDFDKQFIYIVGLGPFAITLLISLITGDYLRGTWCTPYFSLFGILSLAILQPEITAKNFKQFLSIFVVFFFLTPVVLYGGLYAGPYITYQAKAHTYIPGKNMATALTNEWHERYHQPLMYVAGEHYLLTYISAYSVDKPVPYFDWDHEQSAWINEADLRKHGAIFIWYITNPHNPQQAYLPEAIKARFPNAIEQPPQTFQKLTHANVEPVTIGVAFLPPESLVESSEQGATEHATK